MTLISNPTCGFLSGDQFLGSFMFIPYLLHRQEVEATREPRFAFSAPFGPGLWTPAVGTVARCGRSAETPGAAWPRSGASSATPSCPLPQSRDPRRNASEPQTESEEPTLAPRKNEENPGKMLSVQHGPSCQREKTPKRARAGFFQRQLPVEVGDRDLVQFGGLGSASEALAFSTVGLVLKLMDSVGKQASRFCEKSPFSGPLKRGADPQKGRRRD